MNTVLKNGVAPLWAWIIVIVFSSLLIIVSVTFTIKWGVRRRINKTIDLEHGTITRKVTLRRGRVVPKGNTSQLSLTGSKFGLQSDIILEDPSSPVARSKSPFEWWHGSIRRSVSRQSQRSESNRMSIYDENTPRSTPGPYRIIRPTYSTLSLSSIGEAGSRTSTASMSEIQTIGKLPVAVTKTEPVNFSRPQPHHMFPLTSRYSRLSIINETTIRES